MSSLGPARSKAEDDCRLRDGRLKRLPNPYPIAPTLALALALAPNPNLNPNPNPNPNPNQVRTAAQQAAGAVGGAEVGHDEL